MKKTIQTFALLSLIAFTLHTLPAVAEDSATTKAENAASDAKTDAKKGVRKAKRKVRKATGNDNIVKDAKDEVNDASDNLDNAAQKEKNRKKHN